MESRFFPVHFDEIKAQINFKAITTGEYPFGKATFSFIENNHPGTAYGFKLIENNRSIVFITDNELNPPHNKVTAWQKFVTFSKHADLLIHDAQFLDEELKHKSGWGHSSYEQVLKLGLEAEVNKLIFFHHDPNRKDAEIDKIIDYLQGVLKIKNSELIMSAAKEGQEIEV